MGDDNAVRLLLVDDDPAFLSMLESLVGGMPGFTVVGVATDAGAAAELARSLRPDLVVADVLMPRVDGLDAARAIHEELGTPAVILTGNAPADDRNRAQLAGAVGWCRKSDLDCLEEVLRSASAGLSRGG
jgi:DNA-binding NarL/FixJ family response regulator